MRNPQETLRRVMAIANDPAVGPVERAAAQATAERLSQRYGVEMAEEEPRKELDLPTPSGPEFQLLLRICLWLDVQLFHLYATKGGRRRKQPRSRVEGPVGLVLEVERLYREHRKRQRQVSQAAAQGYAEGAFSVPPEHQSRQRSKPLTEAQEAALRGGFGAGYHHRAERENPPRLLGDGGGHD